MTGFLLENRPKYDYSIMIPHISPESDIISVLGLISIYDKAIQHISLIYHKYNTTGLNLLRFDL